MKPKFLLRILCLALLGMVFVLAGCEDDDNGVQSVALSGRVSGRVVDSFSSAPIAGVTVSTASVNGTVVSATTDADGFFTLADIPITETEAGLVELPLQLTINAPAGSNYPQFNFWAVVLERGSGAEANTLLAANVTIELHATTGTVTGTIRNPLTGDPLPGVEVTMLPEPLVVEPTTGIIVAQPFAAPAKATTGADGVFTVTNVPADHDYVIDIVDPSGTIANVRLGVPNTVGGGVVVPPGTTVNLDAGFVPGPACGLACFVGGVAGGPLAGAIAINPSLPEADAVSPFVASSSIAQGQDVAFNVREQINRDEVDIRITFSEQIDPASLSGIVVRNLGIKGGAATTGPVVPATVSLDPDNPRVVVINPDVDLIPGNRYVIVGLGGVTDLAGNSYAAGTGLAAPGTTLAGTPDAIKSGTVDVNGDGVNDFVNNALFFTTNANNSLLALSGPPTQVAESANNTSKRVRNAINITAADRGTLSIDWSAVAPVSEDTNGNFVLDEGEDTNGNGVLDLGPRGYRIYVNPDINIPGLEDAFTLVGQIGPQLTTPPTTFTLTLDTLGAGNDVEDFLEGEARELPALPAEFQSGGSADISGNPQARIGPISGQVLNTIFDEGLDIAVKVTVLNADGTESPLVTAPLLGGVKDNTPPGIETADTTGALVDVFDETEPGDTTTESVVLNVGVDGEAVNAPAGAGDTVAGEFDITALLTNTDETPNDPNDLDITYNADDWTAFAGGNPGQATLSIPFNEDLSRTATFPAATLSAGVPPGAPEGTPASSVDSTISGPTLDEDVGSETGRTNVKVTLSNAPGVGTGSRIGLAGVVDEAGNAATQAEVIVDNRIGPFIASAVAAQTASQTLTVTFNKPVDISGIATDTDGDGVPDTVNAGVTLGLSTGTDLGGAVRDTDGDGTPDAGAAISQSADGRTITITTDDGFLDGIVAGTTMTGAGITDTDFNANPANAFTFATTGAQTARFLVADQIPPRVTGAGVLDQWDVNTTGADRRQDVDFSEALDPNSVTVDNFSFVSTDDDTYQVTAVELRTVGGVQRRVRVTYTISQAGTGNGQSDAGDRLVVRGVTDLAGNPVAGRNGLRLENDSSKTPILVE